ncbi:MAG: hypothetical protein LCI02_05025 [Proteobacteria bacterium]|nr:hypothetical protein [Pseudomonadota bacterium]
MNTTHRRLLRAAALACTLPLAGCITMPETGGWLTNSVVTTVDGKACMSASRWGPVTITGDINASECKAILEGQALRAAAKAKPATGSATN